eukprot:4914846-Pleurochrysis_carterae.AAC.3
MWSNPILNEGLLPPFIAVRTGPGTLRVAWRPCRRRSPRIERAPTGSGCRPPASGTVRERERPARVREGEGRMEQRAGGENGGRAFESEGENGEGREREEGERK